MTSDCIRSELLIIGAGPVGLYGAYCAGFRGHSVTIMDALPKPGGQVAALYPGKPIYDIAGLPSVTGRDLVEGLERQAERYDPTFLLGHRAVAASVTGTGESFPDAVEVVTHKGTKVTARAVVITGGVGAFTPRPLAAAAGWEKRGFEYFVSDPGDYRDVDVVVVGGGDSALDWALMLESTARSVTLVHRRATFTAHPGSVDELRRSSVAIVTDAQVTGVFGEGSLSQVAIAEGRTGATRQVPAQRLLAALGFHANLGPLTEWGLDVVDRRYISVDQRMATTVPGFYAAGDIAEFPGKVRIISVGFGEVATAVSNASVAIDPSQSVFPGHSTHTG